MISAVAPIICRLRLIASTGPSKGKTRNPTAKSLSISIVTKVTLINAGFPYLEGANKKKPMNDLWLLQPIRVEGDRSMG